MRYLEACSRVLNATKPKWSPRCSIPSTGCPSPFSSLSVNWRVTRIWYTKYPPCSCCKCTCISSLYQTFTWRYGPRRSSVKNGVQERQIAKPWNTSRLRRGEKISKPRQMAWSALLSRRISHVLNSPKLYGTMGYEPTGSMRNLFWK